MFLMQFICLFYKYILFFFCINNRRIFLKDSSYNGIRVSFLQHFNTQFVFSLFKRILAGFPPFLLQPMESMLFLLAFLKLFYSAFSIFFVYTFCCELSINYFRSF